MVERPKYNRTKITYVSISRVAVWRKEASAYSHNNIIIVYRLQYHIQWLHRRANNYLPIACNVAIVARTIGCKA